VTSVGTKEQAKGQQWRSVKVRSGEKKRLV